MNELATILLVDDDPRDVELSVTALEEAKLANRVVVVNDGAQALDYLCREGEFSERPQGNPAVVFLDLKLPKIGGLEVLERIRSDPELVMIPVVILTSSAEENDVLRSYRLSTNAYVVKPVDFDTFMTAVREAGIFWAVLNEPPPGSDGHAAP